MKKARCEAGLFYALLRRASKFVDPHRREVPRYELNSFALKTEVGALHGTREVGKAADCSALSCEFEQGGVEFLSDRLRNIERKS